MDQSKMLTPENFAREFEIAGQVFSKLPMQSVEFTRAKAEIPGVWAQYMFTGPRLQVQLFAEPGKKFPRNFGEALKKATASLQNVVVDYIPEVSSWYLEVPKIAMPGSFAAEAILKKVAGHVEKA